MPRVPFPQVKLSFLKKLLPKKSDGEAASEPTTELGSGKRQDEKAQLQELPLEECPICHDPVGVANPEGIRESWVHLHCKHKFGTHCIQTWLQESAERDPHSTPSCPICRTTAKHPCGHPVVMPTHRLPPFTVWPLMPPSSPPPLSSRREGRRPRRRLSRRWGHPHRPLPPRSVQPQVQTVGECNTCAAVAAQEKRMKEMITPSVETGGATCGGRGRSNDRHTGIKSMLLLQTGLRRRSTSAAEPVRSENYRASINMLDESSPAIMPVPSADREWINLCQTEATVARSPTPTPNINRVLSF
ncbi:hypothetical protein GGR51DRAFT_378084 [Nemania sp. FL0031]|nr:hypothetical protein GGR51DRAFT_378084 [Nemania sp. FL0031]